MNRSQLKANLRGTEIVPMKKKMDDDLLAPVNDYHKLFQTFMGARSVRTQESYNYAIDRFCSFVHAISPSDLVKKFVLGGSGPAHLMIYKFREHLTESGKSASTINLQLAAIRSLVKFAKKLGVITWDLSIEGLPVVAVRDSRGPGEDGVNRVLTVAMNQGGKRAVRDTALVRLMWDLGLREGECIGLDVEDVDFERGLLWILGKKRKQKESLTMPAPTIDALRAYIGPRVTGPVFLNLDRAGKGTLRRLTGRSVRRIVAGLARSAGMVGAVRPHGIRHAAITAVLDAVHGNVRVAKRFSRHKSADTVLLYDDNRQDLGGEAAKLIADRLRGNGGGLPFIQPIPPAAS